MECFNCKQPGHLARDCPSRSPIKSGKNTSSADEGDIPVMYCDCGAGPCIVRTSHTPRNPNRKFFCCPNRKNECRFFEWCDKVKSPQCPCGAGACSIRKETSGNDKGKRYFACRIKKGHGACSFFQWVDPQEDTGTDSNINIKNHKSSPFASTSSPVANAASDSCEPSCTSSSSHVANTVSELCNGSALHVPDPTIADINQSQHSPDSKSVPQPLNEEKPLPVKNRESNSMSSILTPASPNDLSDVADSSSPKKADSLNSPMPQSLWGSQAISVSEIHNQNFDVRTPSLEVQSPLPWADSCSFRSQSSDNLRYAHSLESDASRPPANLGQSSCSCKNHQFSNYRHYPWADEINAGLLMRIDQLKGENNELKNVIESLRKQVATYAEKEKVLVPKGRMDKILEIVKDSVFKLCFKLGFALVLPLCLMFCLNYAR